MLVRKQKRRQTLIHLAALAVAAWMLAPPVWLFVSSVSSQQELLSRPVHWIPRQPRFDRYQHIFTAENGAGATFRRSLRNSLVVAVAVTALCLVFGALAAYALARLPLPKREAILVVLLLAYMLPPIMILVPLYSVMARLHLTDTLPGLVLVYAALILPFAVWVMRNYFLTLPRELEDAARIDGCTRLGVLTHVVLPLSTPGLTATALLCFLMSWEEFVLALVLTSTPNAKTIPVAIAEFTGRHAIDYGMMAAGGVVAALPPIALALLLQKYLVSGLTAGSVKG